jgi:hypothetical protein
VVGNSVTFARVTNTNFSVPLRIEYNTHSGAFAHSNVYDVAIGYGATGGAWHVLRPIVGGDYAGNDMALDVYVLYGEAIFRLRRLSGSTAGTAFITITAGGDAANTTVESSVAVCTVATPCTDVPTVTFAGSIVSSATYTVAMPNATKTLTSTLTIDRTDIATTTPAAGAIPQAGTDAHIASGWLPTNVLTGTHTHTVTDVSGAIPDSISLSTVPPLALSSQGTISETRTSTSTSTTTVTLTNSGTSSGTGTGSGSGIGTGTALWSGTSRSADCTKPTTAAGTGTCTGATASVTVTITSTITATGTVSGTTTGTVTGTGTGSGTVTASGATQTVNLVWTDYKTWTYTLWSINITSGTYTATNVNTQNVTGTVTASTSSTSTATITSTSTSTATQTTIGTSTNKATGLIRDNLTALVAIEGAENSIPKKGPNGSLVASTVSDDGTGPVAPNLGLTDGTPGKTLLKPGLTATALLLQSGYAVTIAPNGNVYLIGNSKIYLQVAGVGNFVDLNQTSRSWQGIRAMSNGDVVAVVFGGGVYRQTGGTGDFVSTGDANRSWQAVGEDTAGNEWFVADDIYVRAGHTGALTALGTGSNAWSVIDGAKDGSVVAGRWAGQLYRKAVGGSTFDLIAGSPTAQWNVAHGAPNGDFYVTTTEAGLGPYLLTSGGSSWVNLAIPAGATNGNALTSVAVDAAGRVLAVGSRYYQLVAAAVEMRMPSTNGTPGQVLGTDGSGQWIWTTVNTSTGTGTATNTFTQAGLKKVNVQNNLVYSGSTTLDVSEVTNALARPSGTCPSGYALTSTTPGQTACVAVSGNVGLYPNGVNCIGKTKFYGTDGQLTWCGDATAADVGAIASFAGTGWLQQDSGGNRAWTVPTAAQVGALAVSKRPFGAMNTGPLISANLSTTWQTVAYLTPTTSYSFMATGVVVVYCAMGTQELSSVFARLVFNGAQLGTFSQHDWKATENLVRKTLTVTAGSATNQSGSPSILLQVSASLASGSSCTVADSSATLAATIFPEP